MFAGAVMIGCHHEAEAPKEKPTTMPTLYGTASQTTIAAESQPVLVQSGEPPLAYKVGSDVTVRITDMNAGETLFSKPLKNGDYVAVTADNGVIVDGEKVVKGPLPEGHRFGIYLEKPSSNIFGSGAIKADPR